jgi:hypothetical protein
MLGNAQQGMDAYGKWLPVNTRMAATVAKPDACNVPVTVFAPCLPELDFHQFLLAAPKLRHQFSKRFKSR